MAVALAGPYTDYLHLASAR